MIGETLSLREIRENPEGDSAQQHLAFPIYPGMRGDASRNHQQHQPDERGNAQHFKEHPKALSAQVRVVRQRVMNDVHERAESVLVQQESEHHRERNEDARYTGKQREPGRAAHSPDAMDCKQKEQQSERQGQWLDGCSGRRADAEKEQWPIPAGAEGVEEKCACPDQENSDDQVSLPRLGWSIPAVEQCKQSRAIEAAQPVIGPGDDDHRRGHGGEQDEIEGSPRQRAAPQRVHHAPVRQVDAWHVHPHDVLVWSAAVVHQEAHVINLGGIVDKRPVNSASGKGEDTTDEESGDAQPHQSNSIVRAGRQPLLWSGRGYGAQYLQLWEFSFDRLVQAACHRDTAGVRSAAL